MMIRVTDLYGARLHLPAMSIALVLSLTDEASLLRDADGREYRVTIPAAEAAEKLGSHMVELVESYPTYVNPAHVRRARPLGANASLLWVAPNIERRLPYGVAHLVEKLGSRLVELVDEQGAQHFVNPDHVARIRDLDDGSCILWIAPNAEHRLACSVAELQAKLNLAHKAHA